MLAYLKRNFAEKNINNKRTLTECQVRAPKKEGRMGRRPRQFHLHKFRSRYLTL